MPAVDYPGQVYTLLADRLAADGSNTRAVIRSFVRFDKSNPHPDIIKNPAPGDCGRLIWLLDTLREEEPQRQQTFKQCGTRTRTDVAIFRARIILDDVRLLPATSIVAAIRADLDAARNPTSADGRDLGLDGCNTEVLPINFRPRRTKTDEDAPDRYRLVGDLLVPVRITYLG